MPPSQLDRDDTLGPTRVRINCNGSGHAGDQSRPLAALLDRMEQHALDEDRWGECAVLAHGSVFLGKNEYVDTGPVYADAPHTVRFWGNFKTYSHAFSIDTDDAEVIELLTAAVAANRTRFSSDTGAPR